MSDFSKMTVAKLKDYAAENNIDLGSAKTKTAILSVLTDTVSSISLADEPDNVIRSDKTDLPKRTPSSNTKADENGVLTVKSADNFKNKEFKKEKANLDDKIAIYSEKNMNWVGVGAVKKGYNIVTREASDKWLTRKGIREASSEEVASHYGL